jgi:hypothetical protein
MIKTDDVVKFNNVIDLASRKTSGRVVCIKFPLVKKIVLYTQLA